MLRLTCLMSIAMKHLLDPLVRIHHGDKGKRRCRPPWRLVARGLAGQVRPIHGAEGGLALTVAVRRDGRTLVHRDLPALDARRLSAAYSPSPAFGNALPYVLAAPTQSNR